MKQFVKRYLKKERASPINKESPHAAAAGEIPCRLHHLYTFHFCAIQL